MTLALAVSLGSGLVFASPAHAVDETDVPTAIANVAIVMPLTVPITDPAVVYVAPAHAPTSPSLMDAETLAFYTAPSGALTTQLDAVYDRGVTIGIDPMIIASIRALGSTAPPSALEWLNRLAAATNETFPLTWADSDMTAPLQAGRRSIVNINSLDFAIDPTRFSTSAATAPPSGNDTQAPPLPTTADLLAWNYTLPSIAWPRADTVDTSDFDMIASTYDTTLLSSTNVTRADETSATAAVGSEPVVVADQPLSELLEKALTADTVASWDASIEAVTNGITAAAASRGAQPSTAPSVVLTLDRDTALPTDRLTATIAAITDLPAASVVGLTTIITSPLLSTAGQAATLIAEPQSDARVARTKRLLAEESIDARFSEVAADPSLITGERRARLLVVLSPAAQRQAGGWGASTNAYLAESTALLQSVHLEQSSNVLLLADRQLISFAVRNDLSQSVTAYIEVRSLYPGLKIEDDRVAVTIEPNSQRKGAVPVQAISNGDVDLAVSLMTPEETKIGETEYVTITVRAGWEGPFTLIGGILVVLVFAFGILRTVLKRRRARVALPADE